MRFEPCAIRHVNGMRRNIVNRGEAIVAAADGAGGAQAGIVGRRVGQRGRGGFTEQLFEKALQKARLLRGALRRRNPPRFGARWRRAPPLPPPYRGPYPATPPPSPQRPAP